VWKKSGKLLIEKKKRESGPKLRLGGRFGTNSGPRRGRDIHRWEPKWFSRWGFTAYGRN
jgi:hypothetical protein